MAKECTLSTGKLPLGDLPKNSVVMITDCPDIVQAASHLCGCIAPFVSDLVRGFLRMPLICKQYVLLCTVQYLAK